MKNSNNNNEINTNNQIIPKEILSQYAIEEDNQIQNLAKKRVKGQRPLLIKFYNTIRLNI